MAKSPDPEEQKERDSPKPEASWLSRPFRRQRAQDVLDSKRVVGSGKDPVLYLRPFSQDAEVGLYYIFIPFNPWTWKLLARGRGFLRSYGLLFKGRFSFERLLQRACQDVGPVIGIGRPGQRMPSAGIVTEYVGDDWQDRVRELVAASQLVVMRAGTSEGLMWEITAVMELTPPDRLLLYVGNGQPSRRNVTWFLNRLRWLVGWLWVGQRKRARFYAEFRALSSESFPRSLPESIGRRRFIRFDNEWNPIVASRADRSPTPTPAEQVVEYMDSVLL